MLVFMLSGIWHGASWTFVIWGALHGMFLVFGLLTAPARDSIRLFFSRRWLDKVFTVLSILFVFHLVSFAWIFFRANTVSDAFIIISKLTSGWEKLPVIISQLTTLKLGTFELGLVFFMILLMEIFHTWLRKGNVFENLRQRPAWQRWGVYYLICGTIVLFGKFDSQQFIYFQF
jgi:D-alanyl-lipoteichoic acid acyltransferase DltB (MBOAT superfamily)